MFSRRFWIISMALDLSYVRKMTISAGMIVSSTFGKETNSKRQWITSFATVFAMSPNMAVNSKIHGLYGRLQSTSDTILRVELNVLEKKAVYSSVGKHDPHDFTVIFSDAQGIQRLRGKLSKAILVLDSCMDVASGYEAHCEVLKDIHGPAVVGSAIFVQVECYRGRIKTHRWTASMLMGKSGDILQLLFQFLKNRNDDTLVQMNKAMQQNSDVMTRMTIATNAGTEAITRVTQQGQSDSRFIKILTFAAMLYLPATLVVVTEAISSLLHRLQILTGCVLTHSWNRPMDRAVP
ncbi:hypothetical protein BDD12DRAFT_936188 [Trichophaea hybrida]|nr:hypothetical protein BDD12DRAFT_936188 [Trichophaea hybrida]